MMQTEKLNAIKGAITDGKLVRAALAASRQLHGAERQARL